MNFMKEERDLLDMSPIGMIFRVVKSKEDTDGKSLDLEWEILPQCNMVDPLYHVHPEAIETYHILEGEMEFFIGDKWITAKTGDRLVVEKGVKHAFRNPTSQVVRLYNTHEPALAMEAYFRDVVQVVHLTKNPKSQKVSMKNIKTLLHFGRLMMNYRKEIIAVDPPDFAVKILGLLAKLLGMDYREKSISKSKI